MSNEHKKYLKKRKQDKFIIYFWQLGILIIFISLWQLLVTFNIIDQFIFSSPKNIISTIISLYNSNDLFIHIGITIYETLISFTISMIIGISIASILWYSKSLAKIIEPYLTILNSLPKVALGPIILIWFGTSTTSIIIMAILISAIVLTINIYNGFNNVDNNKIKLMKSLTKSKFKLFRYLIFPNNISTIISNLKICISMSLIGLLPPVGEKIFFNKCYSRY